ncbi:group II intron maturase-specific domain-containing protein [Streptomyces sp. NBC_01221]|uniref:group II intron maturase-specific domain-containing protein n=1 Tax=Streptomyces sp. NBC_01221 TaxID=2903782 RepID=UPI00338ECD77
MGVRSRRCRRCTAWSAGTAGRVGCWNAFLRGWAAYFRFGNSARHFDKIGSYARMRMAGFLAKRHRRSRGFGWSVVAFASRGQLSPIALHGTVVAPRPFRDWRDRPNAGGERRR